MRRVEETAYSKQMDGSVERTVTAWNPGFAGPDTYDLTDNEKTTTIMELHDVPEPVRALMGEAGVMSVVILKDVTQQYSDSERGMRALRAFEEYQSRFLDAVRGAR